MRRGSSQGAVDLSETICCILDFHQRELISELKICFDGTGMVPLVCPFNLAITNGSELSLPDQKISKGHFDRENLEHESE